MSGTASEIIVVNELPNMDGDLPPELLLNWALGHIWPQKFHISSFYWNNYFVGRQKFGITFIIPQICQNMNITRHVNMSSGGPGRARIILNFENTIISRICSFIYLKLNFWPRSGRKMQILGTPLLVTFSLSTSINTNVDCINKVYRS